MTETEKNHEVRLRNLESMVIAHQAVFAHFLKNFGPMADASLEYAAQYFVNAAAKADDPIARAQAIKALDYVDTMRNSLGPQRPVKEAA